MRTSKPRESTSPPRELRRTIRLQCRKIRAGSGPRLRIRRSRRRKRRRTQLSCHGAGRRGILFSMPTGAELFVETITGLGIDRIFTLVGDHLNEVLAVAAKAGVQVVDMRHESGVTHMADAWARITRKPALSLVTGGPGHTNSLTGIATAQLAASPLIAVSGSRANAVA